MEVGGGGGDTRCRGDNEVIGIMGVVMVVLLGGYSVTYEADSPDEVAFVIAARELGFEFYKRIQTTLSSMELDRVSKKKVERLKSPSFGSYTEPVFRHGQLYVALSTATTSDELKVLIS
ncbi:putative phospholipid-transporting ATPase 9 [Tanacetum coccineum]